MKLKTLEILEILYWLNFDVRLELGYVTTVYKRHVWMKA